MGLEDQVERVNIPCKQGVYFALRNGKYMNLRLIDPTRRIYASNDYQWQNNKWVRVEKPGFHYLPSEISSQSSEGRAFAQLKDQ